jgi:hypothetical protein
VADRRRTRRDRGAEVRADEEISRPQRAIASLRAEDGGWIVCVPVSPDDDEVYRSTLDLIPADANVERAQLAAEARLVRDGWLGVERWEHAGRESWCALVQINPPSGLMICPP